VNWLNEYRQQAMGTDRFSTSSEHLVGLASGLIGEAGSIVSEYKKHKRERNGYPVFRKKLEEEIGDYLWYCTRICEVVCPKAFEWADRTTSSLHSNPASTALDLCVHSARVAHAVIHSGNAVDIYESLKECWSLLYWTAADSAIELKQAAAKNIEKIKSRWPDADKRKHHPLFDDNFDLEEQLPRKLRVQFIERKTDKKATVVMRCNGLNLGDRISDNIQSPDFYRFHDVFHLSHAAHLGWSPVLRALLRCKRKSDPNIDENQDGARAAIIEEAVSAAVFARAKLSNRFDGLNQVDYDLLKSVSEMVQGYEVAAVHLWQWEEAILEGFSAFRKLIQNGGGVIEADLIARRMEYQAPI
jgi:NTP pyrophosphatase (non-canonical NTP hydrolase)